MSDPTTLAAPNEEVQQLIRTLAPPAEQPTIEALREGFEEFMRDMVSRGPTLAIETRDETIPGAEGDIPVRYYEPTADADEQLDVIVFLHGGGWVAGDLFTGDAGARALAVGLGTRVVSVDYRLAPEWPFPAALDDTLAAIDAMDKRDSTRRIVVAGESAGGNLAAAGALERRGGRLHGQILINPLLDHASASASYERYATGYGLTTEDVQRFIGLYVGTGDPADPRVTPLNAANLSGVAPCVVTTAGFDPLLDDGIRYAKRLVDDGVPVTYLPMPAMLHGWWSLITASPAAAQELERVIAAAQGLLAL